MRIETIILAAREAKPAGATVSRGISGYGGSAHIHEVWRGFSYDLPVVIEIADTGEKFDAWLPNLEGLRHDVLVMRERVQILRRDNAALSSASA